MNLEKATHRAHWPLSTKILEHVTAGKKIRHTSAPQPSARLKVVRRFTLSPGKAHQNPIELLKNTPVEEIMAGNITRSLTKDVLKIISYEIRSVARLYNDQLLECGRN